MHSYQIRHRVPHSADDMFALVANVEDYPKFLPLCEALRVMRRERKAGTEILVATMTVGYGLLRESFTTEVTLDPASRTILVRYLDGPFAHLENRWHFEPLGTGASAVDFFISYSFRSRTFEHLIGGVFARAVRKYTDAFEARADQLYGTKTAEALLAGH
jgi:coenzyme Q-binding protein COQ10